MLVPFKMTKNAPLLILKQTITTPNDVVYHHHAFIEYTYVEEGNGIYILNGEEKPITKGDFIVTDFNYNHTYRPVDENGFKIINVCFYPQFLDETLIGQETFLHIIQNYHIKYKLPYLPKNISEFIFKDSDDTFKNIVNELYKEFVGKEDAYKEIIRSQIIKLTILFLRKLGSNTYNNYSEATTTILEYINTHFSENLQLKNICKNYNYSYSYICRKLKEDSGLNFLEHLHNIRIQHACRLISNTKLKMNEIAILVGFSQYNHFKRIFEGITNITPSDYRKKTQTQSEFNGFNKNA